MPAPKNNPRKRFKHKVWLVKINIRVTSTISVVDKFIIEKLYNGMQIINSIFSRGF